MLDENSVLIAAARTPTFQHYLKHPRDIAHVRGTDLLLAASLGTPSKAGEFDRTFNQLDLSVMLLTNSGNRSLN